MSKKITKLLLILGCQRSGTTLLAAMLGRHSEINMIFEGTSKDWTKGIGKKYSGNKLLTWRQIRYDKKASKFGYLINRIVNFNLTNSAKPHKHRPFPTSKASIKEYIDQGATIITLTREKEDVVKSITTRTKASHSTAGKEYDKAMGEIDKVKNIAVNIKFSELIADPKKELIKICDALNLDFEPEMLNGTKYNFVYPNDKILKDKKG